MDKPEMIFFEVMRHAVRNPQGVTAASLAELMTDIYSRVWGLHAPP